MSLRILFADDHHLVRQTLKQFLGEVDPIDGVQVDEADSLASILGYATTHPPPALILLDLAMPGMKGVESIAEVRGVFPDARIVVLSGYSDRHTILATFKAGAAGFIPKTTQPTAFIAALKLVLRGERYIPPILLDETPSPTDQPRAHDFQGAQLSDRERKMLMLVAEGKKNKEIAHHFALEEVTVKLALSRLYKKIGANNRAAAVRLAIKAGLV